MDRHHGSFVWDVEKERANVQKHGVDFTQAIMALLDPRRKIFMDARHSAQEERWFCLGRAGNRVLTVRFRIGAARSG